MIRGPRDSIQEEILYVINIMSSSTTVAMLQWSSPDEGNLTFNPYYTDDNKETDSSCPNSTESTSSFSLPGCMLLQFDDFIPWDNPQNLVPFHVEDAIRRLTQVLFLPILVLIGGPANLVNMAVFYKQGLSERINVCLFALSLADELYLVNNMLLYGEQLYLQFTTKQTYGPVFAFMVNHNLLGFYGFTWVSQVISAIIASERCFCILYPLRSKTVLRTSTITTLIVIVNVVVVGVYFFVVSRYRIGCVYNPVSDITVLAVVAGEYYLQHQEVIDYLDFFVYGAGLPGIMMIVVAATTIITAVKLRQAAAWRAGTSSSSSSSSSSSAMGVSAKDLAVTKMLVCNSVFFIVCVFPIALFRFILLFVPEMNTGRRYHNLFLTGLWLLNIISYVNATFNFVVYYSTGSRFRQTFWSIFGRKKPAKNAAKGSAVTLSTVM